MLGYSSDASCKLQKNRVTTGRHIQHHQTFLPFRNSPPPRLSAMKTTKMENMWPLMEVQLRMNFTCFHIYLPMVPSLYNQKKTSKKTFKKPSQKINQALKKQSPQNQPRKSSSHPSIHHTSISDHYITNPKPMHPEGHTQKPPYISPLFDNFSQNR